MRSMLWLLNMRLETRMPCSQRLGRVAKDIDANSATYALIPQIRMHASSSWTKSQH